MNTLYLFFHDLTVVISYVIVVNCLLSFYQSLHHRHGNQVVMYIFMVPIATILFYFFETVSRWRTTWFIYVIYENCYVKTYCGILYSIVYYIYYVK